MDDLSNQNAFVAWAVTFALLAGMYAIAKIIKRNDK